MQIKILICGFFISTLGFLLNAFATYKSVVSRKNSNYQEIVKSHREIWKLFIDKPEIYSRVLQMNLDLVENPITIQERRFVQFVLLHITAVLNFSKQSEIVVIEKLKFDVDDFLTFPIPKIVWEESKHFYNKEFVIFVDYENINIYQKLVIKIGGVIHSIYCNILWTKKYLKGNI